LLPIYRIPFGASIQISAVEIVPMQAVGRLQMKTRCRDYFCGSFFCAEKIQIP
jgi:hypothetical protein